MRTEVRFLLAIALMLLVLVGTNLLFPPLEPPAPEPTPDSLATADPEGPGGIPEIEAEPEAVGPDDPGAGVAPTLPGVAEPVEAEAAAPERVVSVEGPLYRWSFTTRGAELTSATLPGFLSLRRGNGPVDLLPLESSALGTRLVVGRDTLDLRALTFEVEPADGLTLEAGGGPRELEFRYDHPSGTFGVRIAYTFDPDQYVVGVRGRVTGVDRPLLVTDLGRGMAFNEADSVAELRMMSYAANHVTEGVDAVPLREVERPTVENGPYRWVAFKSKYFVMALLPGGGEAGGDSYVGGILSAPLPGESSAYVGVTESLAGDGTFEHRLYFGPMEYTRLQSFGVDLEEVNPYGWKFFRPIIRPIVGVIFWLLSFLHDTLKLGYGWVLVVFGVAMRVVLWPLNQKALRAQMRNMAVQPLLKEIQTKYKDNPERLQKEMMRLYKEYGFNPAAGCLPMLLPWPVLIALFFVFQNTIELRGVPFYWLPDLSAKDPFYILPVFLAASMFALQWISFRSMPEQGQNPQMKMMLWFMPLFFGFIFMQFPSGLNLYYAVANIATIPQQLLIAKERQKASARGPVKVADR